MACSCGFLRGVLDEHSLTRKQGIARVDASTLFLCTGRAEIQSECRGALWYYSAVPRLLQHLCPSRKQHICYYCHLRQQMRRCQLGLSAKPFVLAYCTINSPYSVLLLCAVCGTMVAYLEPDKCGLVSSAYLIRNGTCDTMPAIVTPTLPWPCSKSTIHLEIPKSSHFCNERRPHPLRVRSEFFAKGPASSFVVFHTCTKTTHWDCKMQATHQLPWDVVCYSRVIISVPHNGRLAPLCTLPMIQALLSIMQLLMP